VTGDDRLREDLRDITWIEYVTTKPALTADSVEPRPVPDLHVEMREKAQRAGEHVLPLVRGRGR